MRTPESKILARPAIRAECDRLKVEGRTVVFTNGCFDILHSGHISYLTFARQQGDVLIVGVNSDGSVKKGKGDLRPVNAAPERSLVLAALECVDFVVVFDEDEPAALIAEILPDVLVKGEDWAHYVSGRAVVEQHGGRVVLAPLVKGRSTTSTIGRILDVYGSGGQ